MNRRWQVTPTSSTMGTSGESQDTGMLELQSLQLDVKTLQKNREEDKLEFAEFQQTV